MANAPHIRAVFPSDLKGTKHAGASAHLFITLPGQDEVPLPASTHIQWSADVDDAVRITLGFLGSLEIQYDGEPSRPLQIGDRGEAR